MKIQNIATGKIYEIADGALYPKNAYREIKDVEQKEEPKVDPAPFIETPIEPEHKPEPEKKPAPKTKKRKSSKKSKSKKTTD